MARGKNSVRRRTSLDETVGGGVRLLARRASLEVGPMEVETTNNRTTVLQQQKPTAERYVQEVHDVIEFHWKNLSLDLKYFILGNLHDLNLQKLVGYWRTRAEASSNQIAASSCGCSWYLALNYASIGKYAEARALTLNGCFLQQCYVSPFPSLSYLSPPPPRRRALECAHIHIRVFPRHPSPPRLNFPSMPAAEYAIRANRRNVPGNQQRFDMRKTTPFLGGYIRHGIREDNVVLPQEDGNARLSTSDVLRDADDLQEGESPELRRSDIE
jgi:hypothetical protein